VGRRLLKLVPIVALAAWVATSCLEPTQITVDLRTTFTCANVDVIMMVGGKKVADQTMPPYTATVSTCRGMNEIGTLVVVPSAASGDGVFVRVVAGVTGTRASECLDPNHPPTAKCIEARRVLRFVTHRKLELPITLDEACINKMCPAGTTCDHGNCISENVCTEMCPDAGDDAGMEPDTGVDTGVDAGQDAGPSAHAVLLAAGFENTCAYGDDMKLYCWGDNSRGQLGSTTISDQGPLVVQTPKLGQLVGIAIGNAFACAHDGQEAQCLGFDKFGQLGDGMTQDSASAVLVGVSGTLSELTAGDSFACIKESTSHFCWGIDGFSTTYPKPAPIVGDPGYEQLALGATHACGFTVGNLPFCWGTNGDGELGADPQIVMSVGKPTQVANLSKVVAILGAGYQHNAVKAGPNMLQRIFVWGKNASSELDPASAPSPVITPKDLGIVVDQIAFGSDHACVIAAQKLTCRGENKDGQLGVPGPATSMWQTVTLPDPAKLVAAGRAHTCAVTTKGDVYCWGAKPAGPGSNKPTLVTLK